MQYVTETETANASVVYIVLSKPLNFQAENVSETLFYSWIRPKNFPLLSEYRIHSVLSIWDFQNYFTISWPNLFFTTTILPKIAFKTAEGPLNFPTFYPTCVSRPYIYVPILCTPFVRQISSAVFNSNFLIQLDWLD